MEKKVDKRSAVNGKEICSCCSSVYNCAIQCESTKTSLLTALAGTRLTAGSSVLDSIYARRKVHMRFILSQKFSQNCFSKGSNDCLTDGGSLSP